jgi:hypothetical protein
MADAPAERAGLASGLVSTTQQVGGVVGLLVVSLVAADAGLGAAAVRRRMRSVAERVADVVMQVRADAAGSGWDRPVLGRVHELILRRAPRFARALG